jgi:hypothetical protein
VDRRLGIYGEHRCGERKAIVEAEAGIVEKGRRISDAKEGPQALPHGEFTAMMQADLPFGEDTAQQLMANARHPVISNTDPWVGICRLPGGRSTS